MGKMIVEPRKRAIKIRKEIHIGKTRKRKMAI